MFTSFSVTGCSLELLRTGERGIVTFCKTQNKTILKKLISMGIVTGTHITLKQHFPSLIINIENIDFVLDLESVQAIYVRIIDNSIN
ncbi:FeoA family protein [Nostoc sp. ChiQUE01b]|uniref:FeoA family protein n=1 Tax=Nostoc sp. ChiQUE01b TaxID=3075376 RepID=UPI002AD5B33B|nr:FeoA family protein [Nostoc sp. ChiQUE01b]MDZ8257588.1 FeoA family protein [Nostoc sp. ChiQUE01b]